MCNAHEGNCVFSLVSSPYPSPVPSFFSIDAFRPLILPLFAQSRRIHQIDSLRSSSMSLFAPSRHIHPFTQCFIRNRPKWDNSTRDSVGFTVKSVHTRPYLYRPKTQRHPSNSIKHKAQVIDRSPGRRTVRYQTLLADDGSPLEEVISVRRLRPPPPTVVARFHLGDMVDAWHNEGWHLEINMFPIQKHNCVFIKSGRNWMKEESGRKFWLLVEVSSACFLQLVLVVEQSKYGDGMAWFRGCLIGKGCFGRVYVANLKKPKSRYSSFPPILAVKSAEVSVSSSIQKEKEVLNNLRGCRNVIRCFGEEITTRENGQMVYNLLLQYGSGRTLADLINKSGRNGLPVKERRRSEYELHFWSEEEDVSCFSVEESDTEETGSSNNPLKL
ncbi:hypothetical protein LXL04_006392 [Taraxacum kok-saghyz]